MAGAGFRWMAVGVLLCAARVEAQPPVSAPSPVVDRGAAPAASPAAAPKKFVIDRFTWGREVDGPDPIRVIEIDNDYGDVRARYTEGRSADVSAVIQRLGVGPEGLGVTVERRGDVVSLTVAYPAGRVRDADPEPAKDSMDRLDLTIFVPSGVSLEASTTRGIVEARGLRGSDVIATTRTGDISVSTSGTIQARSTSGLVRVTLQSQTPAPEVLKPAVVQSTSGAIEVTLPDDARRSVRAESAGEVSTELPVLGKATPAGARKRTRIVGNVGTPAGDVLVWSDTGAIRLRAVPR